jgi:cell division transport system permease protein
MLYLLRIIKEGWELFKRRKIITFANIFVTFLMSIFIFIGIFSNYFLNESIEYVKNRLDFSIYFKDDANKEDILKLKNIIENFQNVEKVTYVTKEEALASFQKKFISNPVLVKALNELKINPFVDYIIVRAKTPESYDEIAKYVENSPYRAIIDFLTYSENRNAILRFIHFSNYLKIFVNAFIGIILLFSLLIIFNLTLLAIYSQKEEIEIFKLIGASNFFIRTPFILSNFLASFVGFLLAEFLIFVILIRIKNFWTNILYSFNPLAYYLENFWMINLGILGFLLISILISSFIALQKYLKV